MSYIVPADLYPGVYMSEQDAIDLTDFENTGLVVTSVLQEAIDAACAEIDGYLAKVAAVPLATPPEFIKHLNARLAVYLLRCRADCVTPHWEREITDIRRTLRDIANGTIALDIEEGEFGSIELTSQKRIFTRAKFECL